MKVAICIEVKNENRYLREWLEYHKKLGFDNVILYDNNDSNGENIFDIIGGEINNRYVIYEDIKDKKRFQIPCYNGCIEKYHNVFDWILFIDCDEFLELRGYDNIHSYLSQDKFNGFEQILVNMKDYDDNGYIYDDGRCVLERFTNEKKTTLDNGIFQTKAFIKVKNYNKNFCFKNAHLIELYNTTCDVNGDKIFPSLILFTENEECVIRHYRTKTIEEYLSRHEIDCFYETNIQLFAKKIKNFFLINDKTPNLDKKIEMIKKKYPWYNYYTDVCSPIDIVIVDDGNPLLSYTIQSIKDNISWYNKIFVISTNNINEEENIIYVNQNDIIPNGFEDSDMGLYLHNIKDLSERFIYVYSGTIFNYICFEEEFFNGNKICMQPVNFNTIPNRHRKVCYENNKLFLNRKDVTCDETFRMSKGNFGYMFSRTCCPMLKSENKSCFEYLKSDIEKNKNKINHLIYPTWTRLMYNNFDYIHTSVSLDECDDMLLEIEDPIYKIINISIDCVDDVLMSKIKERYE